MLQLHIHCICCFEIDHVGGLWEHHRMGARILRVSPEAIEGVVLGSCSLIKISVGQRISTRRFCTSKVAICSQIAACFFGRSVRIVLTRSIGYGRVLLVLLVKPSVQRRRKNRCHPPCRAVCPTEHRLANRLRDARSSAYQGELTYQLRTSEHRRLSDHAAEGKPNQINGIFAHATDQTRNGSNQTFEGALLGCSRKAAMTSQIDATIA